MQKDGRFRLSQAAGNVNVNPSELPSVDVFPSGGDLKKYAVWGGLGLLAFLLLSRK
jgi:hypothetical protein